MEAQFLIAGFGGQGVLLIGQLLAKAAMHEGMNVSWMPSYGPEMRGGEANCAVVISDEPIGSPLVTEIPIAVIMNKPSMIKFTPAMEKGGIMLYNSSLIDITPDRDDITARQDRRDHDRLRHGSPEGHFRPEEGAPAAHQPPGHGSRRCGSEMTSCKPAFRGLFSCLKGP